MASVCKGFVFDIDKPTICYLCGGHASYHKNKRTENDNKIAIVKYLYNNKKISFDDRGNLVDLVRQQQSDYAKNSYLYEK